MIFFTLRPSDLITTLTYVLMDNFCPCLYNTSMFDFIHNKNNMMIIGFGAFARIHFS